MSVKVAQKAHSRASESLRDVLADDLARTAATLAKVKQKPTVKGLKQRAEVLEPLARTAKIVHDWGSGSASGLVVLGQVEEALRMEEPVIELPACGPDTPTGSVSELTRGNETPQDPPKP